MKLESVRYQDTVETPSDQWDVLARQRARRSPVDEPVDDELLLRLLNTINGYGSSQRSKYAKEAAGRISALVAERDDLALRAAVNDEALTNAIHMRREIEAERDEVRRYAEQLAVALAAKHYPDVPQWKPFSGDLWGLISQIDNMTTGMCRADALAAANARVERLEAIQPMAVAETGFGVWAAKPHNVKWVRLIAGTPIENDLIVNMADAIRAALEPPRE